MSENQVLNVGDTVEWRGSWGRGFPALAKVTRIMLCPSGDADADDAVSVPAVPWSAVEHRRVVVDLSNRHWAYGFQITPPTGDAGVIPLAEEAIS